MAHDRTSLPLGVDIIEEIIVHLPPRDALRCLLVSKTFHALVMRNRHRMKKFRSIDILIPLNALCWTSIAFKSSFTRTKLKWSKQFDELKDLPSPTTDDFKIERLAVVLQRVFNWFDTHELWLETVPFYWFAILQKALHSIKPLHHKIDSLVVKFAFAEKFAKPWPFISDFQVLEMARFFQIRHLNIQESFRQQGKILMLGDSLYALDDFFYLRTLVLRANVHDLINQNTLLRALNHLVQVYIDTFEFSSSAIHEHVIQPWYRNEAWSNLQRFEVDLTPGKNQMRHEEILKRGIPFIGPHVKRPADSKHFTFRVRTHEIFDLQHGQTVPWRLSIDI